jgi:hypothetical protein
VTFETRPRQDRPNLEYPSHRARRPVVGRGAKGNHQRRGRGAVAAQHQWSGLANRYLRRIFRSKKASSFARTIVGHSMVKELLGSPIKVRDLDRYGSVNSSWRHSQRLREFFRDPIGVRSIPYGSRSDPDRALSNQRVPPSAPT